LLSKTKTVSVVSGNKMNRPPPYFPQNQLSPPDPNRYRKFKIAMALGGLVLLLGAAAVIYGIYYLVQSFLLNAQ
jgi:hypothetical protein